jgi:hypothetical protein
LFYDLTSTHFDAHLRGLPGVLPAPDLAPVVARLGAGADAAIGSGEMDSLPTCWLSWLLSVPGLLLKGG